MITWNMVTEEREIAPGLFMTISREDSRLHEVVNKFLKRKAPIGEVRRAMRVRSNPRCSDMGEAAATNGGREKYSEETK